MTYAAFDQWRRTPLDGPPDVSIVVPAYDESRRITPTIGAIAAFMAQRDVRWELIVSDDGSNDGTAELVQSLALVNATVLAPPVNRGKGAAVRDGILAARGELVLFSDADLSTPIEMLPRLEARLNEGADVAVGSRAAGGASEAGRSRVRRVFSSGLRLMVRRVLRLGVHDTQCGFKLFRRDAAQALFALQQTDGFSFDLEILFLARRLGLTVAEVPVDWVEAPGSKVEPMKVARQFLRDIVAIRFRALTGTYDLATGGAS